VDHREPLLCAKGLLGRCERRETRYYFAIFARFLNVFSWSHVTKVDKTMTPFQEKEGVKRTEGGIVRVFFAVWWSLSALSAVSAKVAVLPWKPGKSSL
jgi:hypothetical protein